MTKQIPSIVSRRISDISCNKEYFNEVAPAYNSHLKLVVSLKILNSRQPPHKGTVTEKFIQLNPPYSVNVKSNIGRIFLRLIDEHFPQQNTSSYSVETISRSAIVVCQTWQVSSETITPVY